MCGGRSGFIPGKKVSSFASSFLYRWFCHVEPGLLLKGSRKRSGSGGTMMNPTSSTMVMVPTGHQGHSDRRRQNTSYEITCNMLVRREERHCWLGILRKLVRKRHKRAWHDRISLYVKRGNFHFNGGSPCLGWKNKRSKVSNIKQIFIFATG